MEEGKDISNIIKNDKFLAGLLVIIVIAIFSFIGYVLVNRVSEEQPAPIPPEDLSKKQAESMEMSASENPPRQLTEEEIKQQEKAMEKSLSKNPPRQLTEEEIKQQIESMESLNKN